MIMDRKSNVTISYIGNLAYPLPEDILLVEKDKDYVRACHTLLQHRESGKELKIWVRSRALYIWLQKFAEQIIYPVIFEEKTPLMLLADQWNVKLPGWLSDDDVIKHNLLDIKVDTRTPICFETRYLSHLMGAAFDAVQLTSENLVAVVKALVAPGTRVAFKGHPLLDRCLNEKCALWSQKADETWVKDLCTRITGDIGTLWHCLSAWLVLHSYPDRLLEYVLAPDQVNFVRRIPVGVLGSLPLEPAAREQALTQILEFLKEVEEQVDTSSKFKKIVHLVSGRYVQEYDFLLNILKSNRFEPFLSDVEALQDKFESCPGVTQVRLNALKYIVRPEYPALIGDEETWDIRKWIGWTASQYIPYRAWQVNNKYYDDELEDTIKKFTEWYVSEYAAIHQEMEFSLAYSLSGLFGTRAEDELAIVLLIDCLPLQYVEILNAALRGVGLYRHGFSYRFSGLPTVTADNKAAIFAGNWLEDGQDYETILKGRSASDWGDKEIIYLRDLRAMAEVEVIEDAAVVILNLLEADETLHSDVEAKNTSYEDELQRIFHRVADEVGRITGLWGNARDRLNVYVVTDHGACRILEEEKKSFESRVVKKLFPDEKYRFSVVKKEQAEEIPPNLWDFGYQFKRPLAPEDTVYFIPKGHNTVRHAGPVRGHLHGGATPEEVVVPAIHYKLIEVTSVKPFTRFLNLDLSVETNRAKFYIQRVVTIEIEMQNPNKDKINVFRASIISPAADLKGFETLVVPAGGTGCLEVSCYFEKSALGEKDLELEVAYEIAGERHTLQLSLKSEFVSAQKGGFSLKDL